jgi:arylsulfatase A-like enzyme
MRRVAAGLILSLLFAGGIEGQSPGSQGQSSNQSRPNVVLIMMDDFGYGDLASYGARDVKTPNIDRLARGGIRFTESYANAAVCSPTRAALMTGRYPQRAGIEWVLGTGDAALIPTGASLPALLKKSGYATALIGKWHLGYKPEVGPNAHGFDEFFGFLGGALEYYQHTGPNGQPDLYENTTPVEVNGYFTDVVTDRAVSFINRHAAGPFFVDVAYNATHMPFQPPDGLAPDAPRQRAVLGELPGDPHAHTRQDYVRMVERVDHGVGEILHALEGHGLDRNTLVIFTSDNGGEWLSRNEPFFNRKGTLWEGGIRVPLLMYWPAHLPAGKTSSQVAVTMDLTASVLAATRTPKSVDYPLDGIDLLPVLREEKPVVSRDVFWRIIRPTQYQQAVRSGSWKLLLDGAESFQGNATPHIQLFDLSTDAGERHDLARDHPQRVADLRARIKAWNVQVAPVVATASADAQSSLAFVVPNASVKAVADQVKAAFIAEGLEISGSSTANLITVELFTRNPAAQYPFFLGYQAELEAVDNTSVRVRLSAIGRNGRTAKPYPVTSAMVSASAGPAASGWPLLVRVAGRLR